MIATVAIIGGVILVLNGHPLLGGFMIIIAIL